MTYRLMMNNDEIEEENTKKKSFAPPQIIKKPVINKKKSLSLTLSSLLPFISYVKYLKKSIIQFTKKK